MSKQTTYFLGILLTIILGTYLSYLYCCEHEVIVEESVVMDPGPAPTTNAFMVLDPNGSLDVKDQDNFNFKDSSSPYLTPLSENLKNRTEEVVSYLKDNNSKFFDIVGYYTSDETNNTPYPNLGLARANAVKNYFVGLGMPSRYIETKGELKDGMIPDTEQIYHGPVSFSIVELAADHTWDADMDAIAAEIKDDPLVLYFKIDQASLNLTPEQQIKVAKISRYLDKVDGALCHIVGHADNTGTEEHNYKLAMDRAVFAKHYFVDNHIPESKLETISKGEKDPIADDSTTEGRAKNRRVVVTLN